MSTTFEGNFIPLSSPETAPRDEMILGQFKDREGMLLTIWDAYKAMWIVPGLCETYRFEDGETELSFRTVFHGEEAFTGWLPLPTVEQALGRAL